MTLLLLLTLYAAHSFCIYHHYYYIQMFSTGHSLAPKCGLIKGPISKHKGYKIATII